MEARLKPPNWMPNYKPCHEADLRLFCFPYCGAGPVVYRSWCEALAPRVEVRGVLLPGRAERYREKPFERMAPLIAALQEAIAPLLDRPFAFFGHSMGAIVAYELARALRAEGREPFHLLCSGKIAPCRPDPNPQFHALPDAELIEELRALGGMPPQVLDCPELLEIALPAIRADFTALETYAFTDGAPLGCPITVFGGQDDPRTSREALEAWRDLTDGPFSLTILPGDHFFLDQSRPRLLAAIALALRI